MRYKKIKFNEIYTTALKDKVTGELFAYAYDTLTKVNTTDFVPIDEVTIFPLKAFTSLSASYIDYDKYTETHILLELKETYSKRVSYGSRDGSALKNVEARLIKEIFNPLELTYEYILSSEKNVVPVYGTELSNIRYNVLYANLRIEPNNDKERDFAVKIIKHYADSAKSITVTLTDVTIKYLKYIRDYKNIKFESNYPEREKEITDVVDLFHYVSMYDYPSEVHFTNELFTYDNFVKYLDGDYKAISEKIYSDTNVIEVLHSRGFSIDEFFKINDEKLAKCTQTIYNEDGTTRERSIYEFLANETYEPEIQTSYDYWCCEECDGYTPDYAEWTYDEQVNIFLETISNFAPFLTEASYPILDKYPLHTLNKIDIDFVKQYLKQRSA